MIWCYDWPSMEKAIHKWRSNPGYFDSRPFAQWVVIKPTDREMLLDILKEFSYPESVDFVREGEKLKCRIVVKYKDLITLRNDLDLFGNLYHMEVLG